MATHPSTFYALSDVKLPERVVLWDETEVAEKQIEQVGASACGATAVLNVLKLLGRSASVDEADSAVKTKLRDLEAPLPQYLLSRSVAGTTHEDLIEGLGKLTCREIVGKFFHMYPERNFDLENWLKYWLINGAIPIATLNCQKVPLSDGTIPDAWHHQVICGVSSRGVQLTNPVAVCPFNEITKQLCSESVLLIRRHDILQRWSNTNDYSSWNSDGINQRWMELKVQEQINRMVKEETLLLLHGSEIKHRELLTTHITIPAAYKSGITLFALRDSNTHRLLENTTELPIKLTYRERDIGEQSSVGEINLSINV
ncbi:uncharacterized protein LOC111326892 [Stylophora pistillata]|uniref:Uncharacterized protein n=1 Tax=Stylophora pistillata TaxID=50429 RepID=A0A2B4SBD2_STYPI|nr:uncharacterized protein LOC111326892 [Stylophora pistillata]PFX27994.1 hypothetical protein AWC38_SpisGene7320 [Stylophora pistillata]